HLNYLWRSFVKREDFVLNAREISCVLSVVALPGGVFPLFQHTATWSRLYFQRALARCCSAFHIFTVLITTTSLPSPFSYQKQDFRSDDGVEKRFCIGSSSGAGQDLTRRADFTHFHKVLHLGKLSRLAKNE